MRLYRVRQRLVSNPLPNVGAEVRRSLDGLNLDLPRGDVAITAGSRGITNVAAIMRVVGEWVRDSGGRPFIVPCMGSHNGATAEGQRALVESLGMTEEATGMRIRSSMDVVKLGTVSTGDVYMDRFCFESAGVIVVNRVKLHTCFAGTVQSGLMKMIVVGMGKIRSAETFHRTPTVKMGEVLVEMARVVVDSGKILAGVAILEDGYDETAEIHAFHSNEILRREPELLERHRRYFPRLPVEHINVLIVDSIGKTYSGTGMDTNVIGRRGILGFEDLEKPKINVIAALSLADESQGNAIGVGLADFITCRLRGAIDEEKTLLNVFTTGDMERAKIPATLADDEVLVERLSERYGNHRWVFIPNTLDLGMLYASEDLGAELESHPQCVVDSTPVELSFVGGRHQLRFEKPR